MPLLGLIGYPLSHSFSPDFFREKFQSLQLTDWEYRLFPIENIADLPELILQNPDLSGLNVTIPHKQAVLQYCDTLSIEVMSIGATNLITIHRDGTDKPILKAYNTDHYGFAESLKTWYKGQQKKALVLGSGGSSKAVQYALHQLQIRCDVAGRNLNLNYENLDISAYDLIINCTPLGMKKEGVDFENELLPLQYEQIQADQYFYDLVYNPEETAMMKRFASNGATVKNGLEMLHLQAEKAWVEIYN